MHDDNIICIWVHHQSIILQCGLLTTYLPSTETVVDELSFSESVADLRRLDFFSLILQMATAAVMAPPATAVIINDVDDEEGISNLCKVV